MGVRLLQVRPIHMGFPWFGAIHAGTLQLQFKIEPWVYVLGCVDLVLSCSMAIYVCVILHKFHTYVKLCAPP